LRRTGGTHLHQAAEVLLGKDYANNYYVASEDVFVPKNIKLSYEDCLEMFKDLEYNKEKKEGMIYANPDLLEVGILYTIIIAKTKEKFNLIRREIVKRLLVNGKKNNKKQS